MRWCCGRRPKREIWRGCGRGCMKADVGKGHPLSVILVLLSASPGIAAPIMFSFAGQVVSKSDPTGSLDGRVSVGDPYSGLLAFNSDAIDLYPDDPQVGVYSCLPSGFQIRIGAWDIIAPEGGISVANTNQYDQYSAGNAVRFSSEGLTLVEINLSLLDAPPELFASDEIRLVPPPLDAFQYAGVQVLGVDPAGHVFSVFASVDTLVLVPEPASILLLAIGWCVACPIPKSGRRRGRTGRRTRRWASGRLLGSSETLPIG